MRKGALDRFMLIGGFLFAIFGVVVYFISKTPYGNTIQDLRIFGLPFMAFGITLMIGYVITGPRATSKRNRGVRNAK